MQLLEFYTEVIIPWFCLQAMRERIRETRHMWTYAYMEQYVTQKVLDTAGDPALDVYRANDTICEAGNYTTVSLRAGPLFMLLG